MTEAEKSYRYMVANPWIPTERVVDVNVRPRDGHIVRWTVSGRRSIESLGEHIMFETVAAFQPGR